MRVGPRLSLNAQAHSLNVAARLYVPFLGSKNEVNRLVVICLAGALVLAIIAIAVAITFSFAS
jgi:hypothetical protein